MRSAVAVSAALALFRAAHPVAAICYYPDGTSANDVPCTDETAESACCGTGYACYGVMSQYFLCAIFDENDETNILSMARGSCTDQDWRSNNCPGVCVEDGRDNLSSGNAVGQCPGSERYYYCESPGLGVANCSTDYNLIEYAADPSALTTIGVISSTSSAAASTSSATATSSTTPAITSPAATTSAAASSGLSSGGKAGVGIGVSLGVMAVAGAAAFFYFLRRRRSNAANSDGTLGGPGIALGRGGYSVVTPSPPYDTSKFPYSGQYTDQSTSGTPHGSPGQAFLAPASEMPASPTTPSEMPVPHAEPRYEMP